MDIATPPPARLTPRTFVPVNGQLHPVTSTDSWDTLATAAGMTAWQLIRFNYPNLPVDQQLAAKEVNWYLKNYVGCTRSTDGRNYAFSSGLTPGKIWIPRRAAGAPPPLSLDEIAKRRALAVLRDPATYGVNFSMGMYLMVTYSNYESVAKAIETGKIRVRANTTMGSNAVYHGDSNIIEFNPHKASDGLIVHECTHALFDVRKQALTLAQNEGSCYVAQHLWELLKTGTIVRNVVPLTGPDWISPISWQGIFDEAARLARKARVNLFLPDDELEALFIWINGANFYRGRAKEKQSYDGV